MATPSSVGDVERETLGATATTGASVLRGGTWYALSLFLPQAYTLAVSVIAARFLGPDGMGRQSYIAFIAVSVTALCAAPISLALTRYVSESIGRGRPGVALGLLSLAWKIEAALALLALLGFIGAAIGGASPRGAWMFAGAVCAIGVVHTIPSAVLIGLQRFREASIAGLITGPIGLAATTAVLAAGGGITGMFAVEAAVGSVNLIWTSLLAKRRLQLMDAKRERAPDVQRQASRYTLILAIDVVLEIIVARRSEVFFLQRYSTASQIAFYSIAFAAVMALTQIPRALASSAMPAFATLHGAGERDRIRSSFSRGQRLLLLATMPVLALSLVGAPRLLELVYGSDYSGTRGPVLVLLLGMAIIPATALSNAVLAGFAHARAPVIASAAAAVVDIGLALLLIPSLHAVGAAIANVGGVLTYGVIVNVQAARLTGRVTLEPGALVRGAVAAALAGVAGWVLIHEVSGLIGLVAALAVVLVVYAGLARVLRILPGSDASWLESALGDRLPGGVGRVLRLCSAPQRES
jgi:O-antigen/teichoic acid export membrane protein